MSKEIRKVYVITATQYAIYLISLLLAYFNREISSNWAFYLLLIGILLSNFIPSKYRSNFFSTDPGLFLKNHTRHFETIIEMPITAIIIFTVIFLMIT